MFHYYNAITNTSGDSLAGYYARVLDPTTGAAISLYADDAGTPIITVSGYADLAVTDSAGNLSFYVEPGTYNVDLYAPDATSFIKRIPKIGMTSSQGIQGPVGPPGAAGNVASTLAELKAALTTNDTMIYDHATFKWSTADAPYTADDTNIIESDNEALSVGAWIRQSAASIQFRQSGTDASGRTTQDKAREILSSEDFDAIVNHDDRLSAAVTEAEASGKPLNINSSYTTTATINWSADEVCVNGSGGAITLTTQDLSVIRALDKFTAGRAFGNRIENQTITQPDNSDPGDGTNNDFSCAKFWGQAYGRIVGNRFKGAAVAASSIYGQASMPDGRHGQYNLIAFNIGHDLQKMGTEHGATRYEADIGNIYAGKGESGTTRSTSHGRRLTGYDSSIDSNDPMVAPVKGIVGVGCIVTGMLDGMNVQNSARYWSVAGEHYADCTRGFSAYSNNNGFRNNDPTLGYAQFTADNVDVGIWNTGGNKSVFNFTINNTTAQGIEEFTLTGALGGNKYSGIINKATGYGIEARYPYNAYDVSIFNGTVGPASISGSYASGSIRAFGNTDAIGVFSQYANLSLTSSTNTGTYQASISGSNGVYNIQAGTGDTIVGGSSNVITGSGNRIRTSGNNNTFVGNWAIIGPITGTGHDFSGVNGCSRRGIISATTNASGEVTVSPAMHSSATSVAFTATAEESSGVRRVQLKSFTSGVATFIVTDGAGAVINAGAVKVHWQAEAFF